MRIVGYIFLLIIIFLGVSFATLNSELVTVNYYVGHRTLPLSLLLVSIFVIGSFLGILSSLWIILKIKMQKYGLQQKLKLAEKEIENLRAIPLQNKH